MPDASSPASQPAVAALCSWLDELGEQTRSRGRSYFKSGRVHGLKMEGSRVRAEVHGSRIYQTALIWEQGRWTAECSCPMETDCKHAGALGLAWVRKFDRNSAPLPPRGSPVPAIATVINGAELLASQRPLKVSFRDQWSPVISQKLGRPLTGDELHRLGQLSALFHDSQVQLGGISAYALAQHGFPASANDIDASAGYGHAFHRWWDDKHPPADPWALWQYIAYDWERAGRPIPEVFRPMTDTNAVRAALEDRLAAQELEHWRRSLARATREDDPNTPRAILAEAVDVRLLLAPKGFRLEVRLDPDKPWRAPTQRWLTALASARPADLLRLSPAAAALASVVSAEHRAHNLRTIDPRLPLPESCLDSILSLPAALPAIWIDEATPWRVEAAPLTVEAIVSPAGADRLLLQLVAPDGSPATAARLLTTKPEPLYFWRGCVHRGPPRLPATQLPVRALADPALMPRLRELGLRLPSSLELRLRRVALQPILRCWVGPTGHFHAELLARSDDPPCTQHWRGHGGWQWTRDGAPPPRRPDDPILEADLAAANAVGARFGDFRLVWNEWSSSWSRPVGRNFPAEFLDWRATLPAKVTVEAQGELAGLVGPAVHATVDFSALPAPGESGRDWFDLTVALRVEDTTLDAAEIALLLKASGKWVQLPRHGWRRMEVASSAETRAVLERLGLDAGDLAASGKPASHRLHALQLAGEADAIETRDASLAAALRQRCAELAAIAPPALPAGLRAELRPYQRDGFHFLAHLAANGLGGILADDMGLGKTVQTLAWLLHLAAAAQPFRALVVCPKSVVHGWLGEVERFAPALAVQAFAPAMAKAGHAPGPADSPALLVANYAQLRLHARWFRQHAWDAVILDEAQFIKNPASQTAVVARALTTRNRLTLTGTPVENRLLDLWSLLAFAQPGLLGTQASFKRQHPGDDPSAPAQLQRRTRHFLLRRTKAQVATDLPARTEDEIVVELEPQQRKLYDAELKRARAQLLGLKTDQALDQARFNILASLLRLRQICCHPALVDPAHRALPSAKLDALLERLEELRDEGHQVLVFSQFVEMLFLIRDRLAAGGIGHLILTGATENRAELVGKFQSDRTQTVFLLSLKAAGFGLNLTAASYAILYDPWWNPAVEAQAIDRAHRIGQTRPVTAYRLIAADTIEQKIRTLQREKAALAGAIVQEESLASVLDLESLRQILS